MCIHKPCKPTIKQHKFVYQRHDFRNYTYKSLQGIMMGKVIEINKIIITDLHPRMTNISNAAEMLDFIEL